MFIFFNNKYLLRSGDGVDVKEGYSDDDVDADSVRNGDGLDDFLFCHHSFLKNSTVKVFLEKIEK